MYGGFRIVNLYPHGKQLNQLEYNACVPFVFSLTDHSFPKVALYSSTSFSEVVFYICNAFGLLSHSAFPDFLNNFFKFAYIEVYSLCYKVL